MPGTDTQRDHGGHRDWPGSRRHRWVAPLVLGAVLVGAAACSSNSTSATTTTAASSAPTTAKTGAAAVVTVGSAGSLGKVLVTSSGATLYVYTPDGTGKSVCTGECATIWPPLTVPAGTTTVTGGGGVASGKLGVITRSDGTLQVTYNGMPLYRYAGDAKSGQATGQGVGNIWYVVPFAGTASSGSGGSTGSTTATTSAPSGQY